jgi:PIN domain nuclease of toxin-antitoxin system
LRVLTDTHTLVWALSTPDALSAAARKTLTESEVTASDVNLWELVLKMRKKDALIADPLPWWEKYVIQTHIPTLAIRTAQIMALGRLPEIRKDPFDRILIAQSFVDKLPIVSKDAQLEQYGVRVIW